MLKYQNIRPVSVAGPCGEILTLRSLPAPHATRWVARRKAEVVAAVDGGLLTIDEVLQRYELSPEEFESWQRAMERDGVSGLRAKLLQQDRHHHQEQPKASDGARAPVELRLV